MCFSATASFVTGTVLLGGGAASVKSVIKPSQIPFALIPLLFAVQQFCEGFVWLSLKNPDSTNFKTVFVYTFLVFAQVIWPIWVPFSFWRLEKNKKRKKILSAFLVIGAIVSVYLAWCLINFPVEAYISSGNISYNLQYPHTGTYILGVFYFIPIVISPFISSVKYVNIIGALIFATLLITEIFYTGHIVSVWCYFAAVISIGVLFIMRKEHSFLKKMSY